MREVGVVETSLGWAEAGEEVAVTWRCKAVARLIQSQTLRSPATKLVEAATRIRAHAQAVSAAP